mgnify:CR=1 FL=1
MKFDQYLNGMVELRLPPQCSGELLRQFSEAGVALYGVRRQKDGLYLWIMLDDFGVSQHLLRQCRCPFHVQRRRGIPFAISRLKRRRGLWLGGILCFAMVYLLLSFLWGYEVSGNVLYSDAHMIALVQEYGLLPGARSDKFDYEAIQKQIVLEHPEFTWILLRPSGTTLTIQVKERLPDVTQQPVEGSIVAKADGRITELLVFRGTPLVKRGQWVQEGQVIIGGWDYSDRQRDVNGEFVPSGQPFAVKAKGVVYGEQERRAVGVCALKEQFLQSTGNQQKQIALVWHGHDFVIHGPRQTPYTYSCQRTEIHSLWQWQQFHLPVYVRETVFEEKRLEQRSYTREEAYRIAVERARKRLQTQMAAGSRFIRESTGMQRSGKQTVVQAEVVWTVEDNLAQVQQKQLPEPALMQPEPQQAE